MAEIATVTDTPAEPETSLADHEAEYAPGAATRPIEEAPDGETPAEKGARDDAGRFQKGRHRAESQRATPDDVVAIAALTKRLREAEDSFTTEKQAGESDRVYQLRRRAEIAERAKAPRPAEPVAVARPVPPVAAVAAVTPPKPDPEKFTYGTSDPDYLEALTDWKTDRKFEARDAERQKQADQAAREAEVTKLRANWDARAKDAEKRYPDFRAVAFDTPQASLPPLLRMDAHQPNSVGAKQAEVVEGFIFLDSSGQDVLYHLLKTPAEVTRLGVLYGQDLREALTLLGQRLLTSSRVQAGPTGSAATSSPSPAPRPPNPVRTGPMKSADEPPGDDDMSIDSHERYFGSSRR